MNWHGLPSMRVVDQRCAASNSATTSAGILPRADTVLPCWLAQSRMALFWSQFDVCATGTVFNTATRPCFLPAST